MQVYNELKLNIYMDRIGRYCHFSFARVPDGWHFDLQEKQIIADRDGVEFFEYLRERDGFTYPVSVGAFFEILWGSFKEGTFPNDELQEKLDDLSGWLSSCEQNKPKWN